MRRVLILVATVTVAITGLGVSASADPPSPLVGRWLGQDFGSFDMSNVTVVIAPSGRFRVTDDAASICLDRIGEFVPVTIQGTGVFSPDGLTLTTDPADIVYCHTARGRIDTGPIGVPLLFDFNEATGRIADFGAEPTGTCFWRTGTLQPADCPPPP